MQNDNKFIFINPLDHMPMAFKTLDEAEGIAKSYIGTEDGFGEMVEAIAIYERVKVVSNAR